MFKQKQKIKVLENNLTLNFPLALHENRIEIVKIKKNLAAVWLHIQQKNKKKVLL